MRDSIETNSGLKPESSEPKNRRLTVHPWLFEVEGGHGRTLRTRRRIEDTRPSGADPVSVFDAARGSHRVTQKNRSSTAVNKVFLVCLFAVSLVSLPFEILLTETLLQGTYRTGQGRSRHLVDLPVSWARFFAFSTSWIHSFRPGELSTTHLRSSSTFLSSAAILGNHPHPKSLDGRCVCGSYLTSLALFSCSC